MLARILLGDDLRAGRMQPFIAAGVIEVPMRVDQMRDGIGAEIGEGFLHLRARHADAGVNQHLAIGPGQDGNVAAGAFQNADIVFRSPCVTIGETAALSLIRLTRPRASAKASRGVSHPPVAA